MNDSVYCYCCEYWQESTGCINPLCGYGNNEDEESEEVNG
jgi:hypothetical protein